MRRNKCKLEIGDTKAKKPCRSRKLLYFQLASYEDKIYYQDNIYINIFNTSGLY